MHSETWKLILFKLDVMIDTTELYILIIVHIWPCPWFKVTVMQESKNCCANDLPKLWMDLGLIEHAVETCWSDESHTHLCVVESVFKGEDLGFLCVELLDSVLCCIPPPTCKIRYIYLLIQSDVIKSKWQWIVALLYQDACFSAV